MPRLLLNLKNTGLTFGGKPVLEGVNLMLSEGERIALVGRNGSGKSTLLKIAADLVEADTGDRFLQPGTTVRYLPQEPDFSGFSTVLEYVEAGLGPTDPVYRARLMIEEVGLTGEENPANLSGGEARRAAIARTLAPDPDILFLDEPTNHLDLPAIEWLEKTLKNTRAAIILISHDRRFLESLSNYVVWLDRGGAKRMDRGFAFYEEWRDQVLEEEEREQTLLKQRIATEEHWMRYGVTARRKRNMRRVALLSTLRTERKEHVKAVGNVSMSASTGESSGKLVIETKKLSKSFGERKIVNALDLLVLRGDRVALVGPNGAGKTTLIKLLTGVLQPDEGSLRLGTNLQIVTLDQSRQSLEPTTLVADVITGGRGSSVTINGETKHVVSYMQDFLFRPEQARTPVSVLSGGERARLILARELARSSNLLILDEPTNDLDLETLDLLQEMLADYPGTILLVSHDRDFVDRIATSVLMYEEDGKWTEYAGGYTDMLAQRGGGGVEARILAKEQRLAPVVSTASVATSDARRKMTFKDKHALETLPKRIAALDSEMKKLEKLLADASLFQREPQKFQSATERFGVVAIEKLAAEDQWLELEMQREDLARS